jgi:DnaK suppressor protein
MQFERDLEFITEDRESEPEERAQEERSARLLARLDDRTLREMQEIDAALQRISNGTYGVCEGCGEAISESRLALLPETRWCRDCEERDEKGTVPTAQEVGTPFKERIPGDLNLLDDSELAELIRERLREDGRIDTEELHILCRAGVVYLSGALPSEPERQILLQLVTDVLGLKEVVDRVRVTELLWEREERSKKERAETLLPWEEPYGTEDLLESAEDDKDFVAPSEPPPKEE